jgi:hypothetical protein
LVAHVERNLQGQPTIAENFELRQQRADHAGHLAGAVQFAEQEELTSPSHIQHAVLRGGR